MSKKHFIAFAQKIAAMKNRNAAETTANVIIDVAKADNPQFNTQQFLKACEIK